MIAPENLRCFLEQHEGRWTAFCVEADLYATARTPAAARASLDRALERFCHECAEDRASLQRPNRYRRFLRYACAWLRTATGGGRLHYVFHAPPMCVLGLA